jgi:hypothetical protein
MTLPLPRRCRDDFSKPYRDRAAAAMTFSKTCRDRAVMDISGFLSQLCDLYYTQITAAFHSNEK